MAMGLGVLQKMQEVDLATSRPAGLQVVAAGVATALAEAAPKLAGTAMELEQGRALPTHLM